MQNEKKPSIFLKTESKHRQVISSKFPKSFRDAGDLVMFYDTFVVFGDFPDFSKIHQPPPSHKHR